MFLDVVASLFALILGFAGVFRAWQMRYKGRVDLISDWDNRPLPDAAAHAAHFARVYGWIGTVLLAMPAVLWIGLPILAWTAILGVIVWYWFAAIDAIADRARSLRR